MINITKVNIVLLGLIRRADRGNGNKIAISKSNRRNKSATRKNRKEKGNREDLMGSKPHSYGEVFCKSRLLVGNIWPIKNNILVKVSINIKNWMVNFIRRRLADCNVISLKLKWCRFDSCTFLSSTSSVNTNK